MIRNEKGVAMMIVLVLATIVLAVTTSMLYLLTQSSRYSGLQKRYASSGEAAMAGVEVMTEYITVKGEWYVVDALHTSVGFTNVLSSECAIAKLKKDTKDWPAGCSSTIYMGIETATPSYDAYFELGNYDVYSKIVYTKHGSSANVDSGGSAVAGDPGMDRIRGSCVYCSRTSAGDFATPSIPGTYIIEIDARNKRNTAESAKFSVLFQF